MSIDIIIRVTSSKTTIVFNNLNRIDENKRTAANYALNLCHVFIRVGIVPK